MKNDHEITMIRDGKEPSIIVINGFLSEKNSDISDWLEVVDQLYPSQKVLHLDWPSSNLKNMFGLYASSSLKKYIANILLKASSNRLLSSACIAISKSWTDALKNTIDTGKWLSNYIDTQEGCFILMGHSLGARFTFHAITSLNRKNSINSAYLFGGAVSNEIEWTKVYSKHSRIEITNCYSKNDYVLKFLYKIGTIFTHKPIGLTPIANDSKSLIYNVDLSNIVSGHTDYKNRKVGQCIKERIQVYVNDGSTTGPYITKNSLLKKFIWPF